MAGSIASESRQKSCATHCWADIKKLIYPKNYINQSNGQTKALTLTSALTKLHPTHSTNSLSHDPVWLSYILHMLHSKSDVYNFNANRHSMSKLNMHYFQYDQFSDIWFVLPFPVRLFLVNKFCRPILSACSGAEWWEFSSPTAHKPQSLSSSGLWLNLCIYELINNNVCSAGCFVHRSMNIISPE